MPSRLEYRDKERQRKRESRRQASQAQRSRERESGRVLEKGGETAAAAAAARLHPDTARGVSVFTTRLYRFVYQRE